jgi:hypothetical protein
MPFADILRLTAELRTIIPAKNSIRKDIYQAWEVECPWVAISRSLS